MNEPVGERVLVAMSGGVDSSVAAALLVERGHDPVGVFMRTGVHSDDLTGSGNRCCSAVDSADAARVCDQLGIPYFAVDYETEFGRIMDDFALEYARGRTPNPCVRCNQWLKFGALLDLADSLQATTVATGHYARIIGDGSFHRLRSAVDRRKNQVYFLFSLGQDALRRVRFPIGEMTKDEVRAEARRRGLKVSEKPESQEICFVPGGDHTQVVEALRPGTMRPGPIVTTAGETVGRHDGIARYTIGQRRGLRVPLGERRYVVRLEPESNTVVVGSHEELGRHSVRVEDVRWTVPPVPGAGEALRGRVQIRYRHTPAAATLRFAPGGVVSVRFDEPQHGVSPGQAAVFFDFDGDEDVLGGGWIASGDEA